MKRLAILLICLMLPCIGQCKKVKYLKIDLLHIVLVKDHDSLVNDSTELATLQNYFLKGYRSGNKEDYHYADTIIKIIMANQDFFMGLTFEDVKLLLSSHSNHGRYDATYRMARFDMGAPLEKVVLHFRYKDLRVCSIEAPYVSNCCGDRLPKKKIWQLFSKRKLPVYSED